ncbi:Ger(x)C family spore germination protein [Cohnella boryungensis]|uniref:Ger(X)C family spore germination C-terminal domain-containing protein n=1 Tax=Cohnella boryungensis TaxID=768479 RepID=A0ABV8SA23_9BACL
MRTPGKLAFLVAILLALTACNDRLDLENATIPLALGIDLDENEQLVMYTSSPVFIKNSQNKSLETKTKALAPRQSRASQGAEMSGLLTGKNYQVIVVGGRLLKHKEWYSLLDVLFRDTKNTTTDRMIYYKGSLDNIMDKKDPDQPILPLLLRSMVDSKSKRSETVLTTVQELHRQVYEKGVTLSISEIDLQEGSIVMKGTALLDNDGVYVMSLNAQETGMFRILKKEAHSGINFSYRLPGIPKTGHFNTNVLSFSTAGTKVKIKTSYLDDRFIFDIKITLPASLSELMFPHDIREQAKELGKKLSYLAQEQFAELIKQFQQRRIDPIGLGIYARAYEYKQFKKVQDRWADAFAEAKVNVKVDVKVKATGPVR